MVAKVLQGSKEKLLKELGLNRLPTYALLQQKTQQVLVEQIHFLIAEGYLSLSKGEYPKVRLTAKGVYVLKGETKVFFHKEERVAPFVIFHDRTLRQVSEPLPSDRS